MKSLGEIEYCNFMGVVDLIVVEEINRCCSKEVIEAVTFESLEEDDVAAIQIAWSREKQSDRHNKYFESLKLSNREVKTNVASIESPHTLELNFLPSYLKYVYLGKNHTLPVIISSFLNVDQERSLVEVLRKYKKAIGWTIADIKRISPFLCMHKILLEDYYINSVDQ